MSAIGRDIWSGLTAASPLDQVNLGLGIVGVWLMIRRSLWAFPVGLVAVTVQGVLFWQAKFYADARLQAFYFGCLAYGWWHWVRHRGRAPELPVTRLGWGARGGYLLAGLVVTLVWAEYQRRHTDAVMPYRDAFIATFGMVAQVLQVRKNLENWPVWVLVNLVTVVSCLLVAPALYFTALLYAIYLVLALAGWRAWRRAEEKGGRMSQNLRIAVYGPESTGKTQLAAVLAARFSAPLVAEYAREFWDRHGAITLEDIPGIAREQWRREDEAALLRPGSGGQAEPGLIICDTEALTTVLWSDLLYGTCPDDIRRGAEQRAKAYALYLLLDIDAPFAPDPQRCFPDPADREKAMRIWQGALERRRLPYELIRGDWPAREARAVAAIDRLLRSRRGEAS